MQRPSWVTDEARWVTDCERVVNSSTMAMRGEISLTEAARQMVALRFALRAEKDADFMVFAAIDSVTDHFPVGTVREQWSPDRLSELDAERLGVESDYREAALQAARRLVEKYRNVDSRLKGPG